MWKTAEVDLHPNCAPVSFLVGTWRGGGTGSYPTIDDFAYTEEITFGHVGKPFLAYGQKTRHGSTGAPLHAETGYLRCPDDAAPEFVIAQPTGIVEVLSVTIDGTTIDLASEHVHLTATAVSVTQVNRHIEVDGDTLCYQVAMAAVGEPMTHHLHAELHRV